MTTTPIHPRLPLWLDAQRDSAASRAEEAALEGFRLDLLAVTSILVDGVEQVLEDCVMPGTRFPIQHLREAFNCNKYTFGESLKITVRNDADEPLSVAILAEGVREVGLDCCCLASNAEVIPPGESFTFQFLVTKELLSLAFALRAWWTDPNRAQRIATPAPSSPDDPLTITITHIPPEGPVEMTINLYEDQIDLDALLQRGNGDYAAAAASIGAVAPDDSAAPKRKMGPTTLEGLLDEARSIEDRWAYPDRVQLTVIDANTWRLDLSTGGWSENEAILDEVSVMFRATCWQRSRRGGHHIFGMGEIAEGPWQHEIEEALTGERKRRMEREVQEQLAIALSGARGEDGRIDGRSLVDILSRLRAGVFRLTHVQNDAAAKQSEEDA